MKKENDLTIKVLKTNLEDFKTHLIETEKTESTIKTYLNALSHFFQFVKSMLDHNVEEKKI